MPLTLTLDLFSCFLMEDLLMTCRRDHKFGTFAHAETSVPQDAHSLLMDLGIDNGCLSPFVAPLQDQLRWRGHMVFQLFHRRCSSRSLPSSLHTFL